MKTRLSLDNQMLYGLLIISLFYLGTQDTQPELSLLIRLLIAVAGAVFAGSLLRFFGYFNGFRTLPRRGDVFLITGALFLSAALSNVIVHAFAGEIHLGVMRTMLGGLAIGPMVFLGHYSFAWLYYGKLRPRRIVLRLLPSERIALIREFERSGESRFSKFLSPASLRKALGGRRFPAVDLIVFSRAAVRDMQADRLLLRAYLAGVPIQDRRIVTADLSGRISLDDVDLWSYMLGTKPLSASFRAYEALKQGTEPIVAALLLLLFSPIFLLITLVIKLSDKGPAFYAQRRTGYLGKSFSLFKFRTMAVQAERDGHRWSRLDDDRVTGLGKWLRKFRLDELPQLWNVIVGDMSFIGPRPERPEFYLDLKKSIPLFSIRTDVRPGITGWAQVLGGYAASVEESRQKLELDLFYIQNPSIGMDISIVLRTFSVMLRGSEYARNAPPLSSEVTASSPTGFSGRGSVLWGSDDTDRHLE